VGLHEFVDLNGDLGLLPAQRGELLDQSGQDGVGGARADYDDGLLAEGLTDFFGEAASDPGCPFGQPAESGHSGRFYDGRWWVVLQQVQHGRVVEVRPEDAL
jgi:hypothetical protein